jgi:hypothetical protein
MHLHTKFAAWVWERLNCPNLSFLASYVGQGGSTAAVNYHVVHRTERYALDIVSLTAWGNRGCGFAAQSE